jgi:hypothetical protein
MIEGKSGIGRDPGTLRPLIVAADRCEKRFCRALFGCAAERMVATAAATVSCRGRCGCARPRGARLQTKAQQDHGRRTDDIARLLPPGAAAMKEKVRRPSFVYGVYLVMN